MTIHVRSGKYLFNARILEETFMTFFIVGGDLGYPKMFPDHYHTRIITGIIISSSGKHSRFSTTVRHNMPA